jgi:hypothetical protein
MHTVYSIIGDKKKWESTVFRHFDVQGNLYPHTTLFLPRRCTYFIVAKKRKKYVHIINLYALQILYGNLCM